MKQPLSGSNQKTKMRNKGINQAISIILIIAGILICAILVMGCTNTVTGTNNSTSMPRPDPETGVVNWISAVNAKNVPRLYELSPDFVRKNITENEFVAANVGNPIMDPGFKVLNYTILNETVKGDTANTLGMLLSSNSSIKNNSTGEIPIFYNFTLSYEDKEWKVWTVPF